MASQFLIDGDLFVEVVDNNDGGGLSQKRVDELYRANKAGRFDDIAFPSERANGYNGVRQLYSRRGPTGEHLPFRLGEQPQFRVHL